MQADCHFWFTLCARDRELHAATQQPITSRMTFAFRFPPRTFTNEMKEIVMKKIALIAALLIGSITAAAAAPHSYAPNNSQDAYFDRTVDVGENGGGGS
jgi:hypothetical protein